MREITDISQVTENDLILYLRSNRIGHIKYENGMYRMYAIDGKNKLSGSALRPTWEVCVLVDYFIVSKEEAMLILLEQ